MWFLKMEIFSRMLLVALGACLLSAILQRRNKGNLVPRLLLAADFGIIVFVSVKLAVFYALYIGGTYALVRLNRGVRRGRTAIFVVSCLLATVPFFYARTVHFLPALPAIVEMVGISYNMLKAIDAIFYVHYAEEPIPFLTYANYMAFFPVITAGPIFRYRDFLASYSASERITTRSVTEDTKRLIRGLFKKVVIEAVLMQGFEKLLAHEMSAPVSVIIIAVNYLILFLDMDGYADIAIALGGFMGIRVPENFDKPWEAPSFTIYYRKWHITLSSWIRDHVFVLLRGKRLRKWQAALVNLGTMFVMGMWHDFGLAGLVQGCFIGSLMAVEALLGLGRVQKRKTKKSIFALRCFVVNALSAVGALAYTVDAGQYFSVLRGLLRF